MLEMRKVCSTINWQSLVFVYPSLKNFFGWNKEDSLFRFRSWGAHFEFIDQEINGTEQMLFSNL